MGEIDKGKLDAWITRDQPENWCPICVCYAENCKRPEEHEAHWIER